MKSIGVSNEGSSIGMGPNDNTECTSPSHATVTTAGKSSKATDMNPIRRQWSEREKTAFIHVLHELVAEGIKTDNSFKPPMLKHCVSRMEERVPGCRITQEHASNKLTVWKRDFTKVLGMAKHSGFGWNDAVYQPIVPSDDVWDLYVRAHPDVRRLRYRCWPLYPDWLAIFGNDRSTGDESKHPDDSFKRMEEIRNGKRSSDTAAAVAAFAEGIDTSSTVNCEGITDGDRNTAGPSKKAKPFTLTPKNSKKEVVPSAMIKELLSEFLAGTNNKIDEGFVKMEEAVKPVITAPVKEPTKAELVIAYVREMNLDRPVRLGVTARIATNPSYTDFFIALPPEDRRDFVEQILLGKM